MKDTQENLSTLTIWSCNVTTSTREPPTCARIRADIWRQDGAICSKNRKIVPYHRCARIPRLTVSVPDYGSCQNTKTCSKQNKLLEIRKVAKKMPSNLWQALHTHTHTHTHPGKIWIAREYCQDTNSRGAGNARDEWTLPAFFARTVRPCCWTAKGERGWKRQTEKVSLFLFTVYLVPFLVVLSCFVHMEDVLLISVPAVYSGRNFAWSWRALLARNWTPIAGKLFGQTKYDWFIYIVNCSNMYFFPFWSGSSLLLS